METDKMRADSFTPGRECLLKTLTSLVTHVGVVDVIVTELIAFLTNKTGTVFEYV